MLRNLITNIKLLVEKLKQLLVFIRWSCFRVFINDKVWKFLIKIDWGNSRKFQDFPSISHSKWINFNWIKKFFLHSTMSTWKMLLHHKFKHDELDVCCSDRYETRMGIYWQKCFHIISRHENLQANNS